MSALTAHRSLGGRLRSELYRNVSLVSLRRPMLEELCRMLTGGPQTLDKLNQALVIHLSYYLATVIEPKMAQLITWPLYDKASERTYKVQLLSFVSMFFNKDGSFDKDKWISPIQPSYLNAGGFKVMQLLFEMSQLALSRLIRNEFNPSGEKLEACNLSQFVKDKAKLDANVETARTQFIAKSINFITYKKKAVILSENYKLSIAELERENETLKKTLEKCIEKFPTEEIENLRDIDAPSSFLSEWNDFGDQTLARMEAEWLDKTRCLIESGLACRQAGVMTVTRNTVPDRSSFAIEYVPTRDIVHIDKLESQVSSQQRYILKNIVKEDKLNFPNLLRGYSVAVCFLFKNVRFLEPIAQFTEHLGHLEAGFEALLSNGKSMINEMKELELKLRERSSEPSFLEESRSDLVIPPLPDVWIRDEPWQNNMFYKPFTPLHSSRILFNMRKTPNAEIKQSRSLFQVPVHTISRPTLFKNISKLHAENLATSICSNTSKSSIPEKNVNRTVDCSAGFTKEQFQRLLSSRKSSSKKFKPVQNPNSHSKARSSLFKDTPENSFTMARSASSPSLYIPSEVKRKAIASNRLRNLYAIAQEESPEGPMEISGIACLRNSRNSLRHSSSLSDQHGSFKSMPLITISKPDVESPRKDSIYTATVTVIEQNDSKVMLNDSKMDSFLEVEASLKTPIAIRNGPFDKTKASSIEKLIEKYKRIRGNTKLDCMSPKLSPITDLPVLDKENDANEINIDTTCAARLPDLVSPSFNMSNRSQNQCDWPALDSPPVKDVKYKCRESLGTALGVDNTFLDQFDLME